MEWGASRSSNPQTTMCLDDAALEREDAGVWGVLHGGSGDGMLELHLSRLAKDWLGSVVHIVGLWKVRLLLLSFPLAPLRTLFTAFCMPSHHFPETWNV